MRYTESTQPYIPAIDKFNDMTLLLSSGDQQRNMRFQKHNHIIMVSVRFNLQSIHEVEEVYVYS